MFNRPIWSEAKVMALFRAKKGYAPPPKKNRGQWATWRFLRGIGAVEERSNGRYYLTEYGKELYVRFLGQRKYRRSVERRRSQISGETQILQNGAGGDRNDTIPHPSPGMETDCDHPRFETSQ